MIRWDLLKAGRPSRRRAAKRSPSFATRADRERGGSDRRRTRNLNPKTTARRTAETWCAEPFATETVSAFLRLEQTRPLHAGVATHNAASIRVLQKCGFTLLGAEEAAPDDAEASHILLRLDA
jgi:hypothetical protein